MSRLEICLISNHTESSYIYICVNSELIRQSRFITCSFSLNVRLINYRTRAQHKLSFINLPYHVHALLHYHIHGNYNIIYMANWLISTFD